MLHLSRVSSPHLKNNEHHIWSLRTTNKQIDGAQCRVCQASRAQAKGAGLSGKKLLQPGRARIPRLLRRYASKSQTGSLHLCSRLSGPTVGYPHPQFPSIICSKATLFSEGPGFWREDSFLPYSSPVLAEGLAEWVHGQCAVQATNSVLPLIMATHSLPGGQSKYQLVSS